MELVNPLTAFTWTEALDINGVPMKGIPEKQGWSFSSVGYHAVKQGRTAQGADEHGAGIRRSLRPLSKVVLQKARDRYNTRDAFTFPPYFIIEPTNICNRACPFCPITTMTRFKNGEVFKGHMEWRHFLALMGECAGYAVYGLSLYQLGESMLWKGTDFDGTALDIVDMVINAKTVGKFQVVNVSTNGDVPNLARLLHAPIDDLIISIDGTTEKVYGENRPNSGGGPSRLHHTVTRVQDFLAEKTRRGLIKPFVRLQIINKENTRDQILSFIRYWIGVPGVDDVFVKNLDSMRAWLGSRVVSDAEDAIKAARVADMPCQHLWTIGSMTVTGDFNACCHDAKTELTDGSNIDKTLFAEWWNGPYMRQLRDEHEGGTFRNPCGNCRERDPWLG